MRENGNQVLVGGDSQVRSGIEEKSENIWWQNVEVGQKTRPDTNDKAVILR